MKLDFLQFRGIFPRIDPELLPENAALIAENCKLSSGALVPWKTSTVASATIVASAKSLYRHKGAWLSWTVDTDVARCPVAGDAYGRLYFTTPIGGAAAGKPQMANFYSDTSGTRNTTQFPNSGVCPASSYHLGMPAPTAAPSLGTPSGGDSANPELVSYVYTYVSTFGEESPPSPESSILSRYVGATVPVTWTAPSSDYTGRATVVSVNIYRTNKGSTSSEWLFVATRPVGDLTWNDTIANANLTQEILATTFWEPPPAGLMGLLILPNGSAAGFKGNIYYESEPYQVHAWPPEYQLSFPDQIVALFTAGMSVLVVTTGPAYVITGNTPGNKAYDQAELSFSCVSKRSGADVGEVAIYAAPVGLVGFGAGGTKLLSDQHLRKEEWQAYYPSTMSAFQYAGNYLAFYNTGSAKGGIVFSLDGDMSTFPATFNATAGWCDSADGELYLVVDDQVKQFDVGPGRMTGIYRTAPRRLPALMNFGAAQVRADSYPVTFRLYDYSSGSAVLKTSKTVADNKPFRLPSGYRYDRVAVEVIFTSRVSAIRMATSIDELALP